MHDNKFYFDLENSEHCYILGYFWADCYFGFSKKGRLEFSFEIKTDDFVEIWPILNTLGFERYSTRLRKNSKKSQSCVRFAKQEYMEFFKDNGFLNKNSGCPLYFKLPEEMKMHFIKGFLDGDGSVSVDKNNLFRVGFNGPKDQNWDFVEDFCRNRNIKYVIYRKDRLANHFSHTKTHGYSVFEFTTMQDRVDLCKSLSNINIGLTRKIDVFHKFKNDRLTKIPSAYMKKINFS
jgi:hypothetical protein